MYFMVYYMNVCLLVHNVVLVVLCLFFQESQKALIDEDGAQVLVYLIVKN
jgi:hypothetical protein